MNAPKHLSPEAKKFWTCIIDDYDLEEHHLKTLVAACEAWDRAQQARRAIKKDGVRIKDRYGVAKEHPCIKTEINNKKLFIQCMRELRLDHEPPPETPRPPRLPERGLQK